MKEETYLLMRRLFFWVIFLNFVFFAPIVVFYSLGYKFDKGSKKFLKTGTISIKTSPRGARVFVGNQRPPDQSPCVLRDLLPKEYDISLEKEGFYPYQINVRVNPSQVTELDIVLLPRRKNVEKLKFDFNIHRFFVRKYLFSEKIIVFTDQGIYVLDSDFKNAKKVSSVDLGQSVAESIRDLKDWDNRLIFWNKNMIWMAEAPEGSEQKEKPLAVLYKADEEIKEVFVGFKDRYLIIQDGLKIIALDAQNAQASFPVTDVNSVKSDIFYDSRSEQIYVRDKTAQNSAFPFLNNVFSLFKIELSPILVEKNEKREPEKTP